jgi:putative NIF3 family GTP cyclohydrolase 1 type 2
MTSAPSNTSAPQTIRTVLDFLRQLAPLAVAESWDNVGHLWGDSQGPVARVMTCLTLSPDMAEEAIAKGPN